MRGAARTARRAVPMDSARAALLYVSDRPEDHPQADFAAQATAKARTDSIFAARSAGVMSYRKTSYPSVADGLSIPVYVFAPPPTTRWMASATRSWCTWPPTTRT